MERMQTIARPTNTTNKSRRVRHIYGVESYNHKQKENVTVIELDNRTVVIKVYNAFQIRERKQRVDNTQIYFNQLLHSNEYTEM